MSRFAMQSTVSSNTPTDVISQLMVVHSWMTNPAQYDALIADLANRQKDCEDKVAQKNIELQEVQVSINEKTAHYLAESTRVINEAQAQAQKMISDANERSGQIIKMANEQAANIVKEVQDKTNATLSLLNGRELEAELKVDAALKEAANLKARAQEMFEKASKALANAMEVAQ